ncbi:tetratricopeptide repeat protein [Croceimicrobium hydrocarbonivorans]|uniref:Tetratricopeptide repeat protein n=1 Tax=Croceimicrobium hydrocarbonivorans TaxID=2761580 RepID=A0A7H0VG47_9FLAO|nr:tetratricopeptide repeat protein [Croceimicrobium hydrocarbonivorans]QNR24695.1 tetratricopeptide repeat protein [Croceimicrobium hydrocarbonivorans]
MFEDENEDDFFNLLDLIDEFKRMEAAGQSRFYDLEEFEAISDYFYETGKSQKALEVLEMAIDQHPYASSLQLKKVQYLTSLDKTREASKVLKELEGQVHDYYEMHMARAGLYSKTGNHQKAIEQYRQALAHTEFPEDVYHLLALEYQLIGAYDKALRYLKMSLALYPEDEIALYNLALCYDLLERPEQGIEYLESFIDENPYSEIAWYHLGLMQSKMGDNLQALRSLDYAILIDDYFSAAYYEKARILEQEFRYQEAAETYQATFEYDGASGYGYYKTGLCYLRLGKNQQAEKYLNKAIQEDAELEEAYYELALLKDEQKQWAESLYLINKAVELDPENWEYRHSSAMMHRRAGKLDEAVLIYTKLIEDEYYNASTFTEYAQLLFDMCEFKQGMDVLYQALELIPDSSQLRYQLAGYLYTIEEQDEAEIYLQKAMALDPGGKSFFLALFPWLKKNPSVRLLLGLD